MTATPSPTATPPPTRETSTADLLRLSRYLRPYLWRWATMVIVAVAGIAATIMIPIVTRAVIDGPIQHRDERGLWTLGAAAVGLGAAEALAWFVRRWLVSRATTGVEAAIRKDLYAHLQLLPMRFHGQWQSGQLLSRIMNDLSLIRRFLGFGLLFLILNTLQVIVVTAILLVTWWPLGVVVIVSFVPIVLLVLRRQQELTRLSRRVQDETGDLATSAEEAAHGVRVIKAFGRGEHAFADYDERARTLRETSLEKVRVSARFWTFLEAIPNLALVVVLGVGALAAGQGVLTMGTLVLFITMMLSLVWPIASLGFLLTMVQEAMTAANRITEVFDTEPAIADGDERLGEVAGRLSFEHVAFRFPDADADVLRDVTLTIEPGETVAVVGATGSGKTTLTALVPRLWDVTGGRITLDGRDVRDVPLAELRAVVASAFEDPTLFSMSVRENLTLGRPGATEAEIEEAIQVAQAGFVHDLPWGLDTRIGEQGLSLSGGQRQRLALARAVVTRPRVLVLDDTLSALDVHTEALVEEALRRVLAGVTGLIVAHRASTVLLADRVALLKDGTITHVGRHADLLATVRDYRELLAAPDELDPDLEPWSPSPGDDTPGRLVSRAVRQDRDDAAEALDEHEEERR